MKEKLLQYIHWFVRNPRIQITFAILMVTVAVYDIVREFMKEDSDFAKEQGMFMLLFVGMLWSSRLITTMIEAIRLWEQYEEGTHAPHEKLIINIKRAIFSPASELTLGTLFITIGLFEIIYAFREYGLFGWHLMLLVFGSFIIFRGIYELSRGLTDLEHNASRFHILINISSWSNNPWSGVAVGVFLMFIPFYELIEELTHEAGPEETAMALDQFLALSLFAILALSKALSEMFEAFEYMLESTERKKEEAAEMEATQEDSLTQSKQTEDAADEAACKGGNHRLRLDRKRARHRWKGPNVHLTGFGHHHSTKLK